MSPATPTEPATAAVVARVSAEALRQRLRKSAQLKGRQPDDAARAQVRALIGDGPHPREQLFGVLQEGVRGRPGGRVMGFITGRGSGGKHMNHGANLTLGSLMLRVGPGCVNE